MQANRFFTYSLKQDVPQYSDLVLFLTRVAIFYSVVASGSPSPGCPFHTKAAEFSVSALHQSQHYCNVYVSTDIPPVLFTAYFLQQKLKVLLYFLHANSISQWDTGNLFPLCSNTAFKPTLDESKKTLQRPVVSSRHNSSINSWTLFQYTRSPFLE